MAKRSNVWAFIIYPVKKGEKRKKNSLPKNYLNIIQNWHIPVLLSPVHDSDKNADDTEKKTHIHVMMYFGKGANKSYEQVKEYSEELKGSNPIIVNNTNAMIRYFIHYDNPEKFQYKRSDLITLSGFEINDAFESYTNDSMFYDCIEAIIQEYDIFNFASLVYFLRAHNYQHELDFLRRHSMYVKCILDGKFHLLQKQIARNKKD